LFDSPREAAPRSQRSTSFLADARIGELRWPTPVIEQFLFDHGAKQEFLSQYGHLELETLRWDLSDLAASEFLRLSVFEGFKPWLESSAGDYAFRISLRPIDQQQAWAKSQTWLVPPVLIDGTILLPSRPGLHLLEGIHELGSSAAGSVPGSPIRTKPIRPSSGVWGWLFD
jgi:hypothetical protein